MGEQAARFSAEIQDLRPHGRVRNLVIHLVFSVGDRRLWGRQLPVA
jgi:hypothetical protein